MNDWEKDMKADAIHSLGDFYNRPKEEFVVNYEKCNYYRTPTKWESFKFKTKRLFKSVFVLPFTWLYGAIKCAFCSVKKECPTQIELANLRLSSKVMQDRIEELESENSVLRDYANNAMREVLEFREGLGAKKKAAKKRPSSKKKRKG